MNKGMWHLVGAGEGLMWGGDACVARGVGRGKLDAYRICSGRCFVSNPSHVKAGGRA